MATSSGGETRHDHQPERQRAHRPAEGSRPRAVWAGRGPAARGNILIGCLAAIGVVLVLLGVVAVVVLMNWRGWVASTAEAAADQMVAQLAADLPAGEGDEMLVQFKRVTEAFRAKDVTLAQIGEFTTAFSESNVLLIASIYVAELGVLPGSGLTEAEVAEGEIALQRLARGVEEGTITQDRASEAMRPILAEPDQGGAAPGPGTPAGPENNVVLKGQDEVTPEDLRAVIESANTAADDAGVPAEPHRVDLSDLLKAQVDELLGEEPATAEPDAPAGDDATPEQPEPEEAPAQPAAS